MRPSRRRAPAKRPRARSQEESGVTSIRRAATLPVSFFDRPADRGRRASCSGRWSSPRVGGERTSGTDRRDRGLPRPRRPGLPRLPPPAQRAERGALRPAGELVRLPVVRHALVRQPGVQRRGAASAVLLRALEPVEGLEIMRRRRGGVADRQLCSGPGRLCQALGITRALDGQMMASDAKVRSARAPARDRRATPRIGITKAADWPLRFVVAGSPWTPAATKNQRTGSGVIPRPFEYRARRCRSVARPVGASPSRCRGRTGGHRRRCGSDPRAIGRRRPGPRVASSTVMR